MSRRRGVTGDRRPRPVTGGGVPEPAWKHQADEKRPLAGPDTPSGVSGANAEAMEDALNCAAVLGAALARFENAVDRLKGKRHG